MVKNCPLHTEIRMHSFNVQLQTMNNFVESGLFYETRPFKVLIPWSFVHNVMEISFSKIFAEDLIMGMRLFSTKLACSRQNSSFCPFSL